MKQYTLEQLNIKILEWSHDKGILTNGNAITQCLKLMSELGELADNLAKDKDVKDDIGDCFVVLTNIAALKGHSLAECGSKAWDDIKDRQGFLNANGNFIKNTDPTYEQQKIEFEKQQCPEPTIITIETKHSFIPDTFMVMLSDNSQRELVIPMKVQERYPINHFFGCSLDYMVLVINNETV